MAIFKMRVLTLTGTPRERGRQHGEELREEIGRHLDLYRENIQQDTGLKAQAFFDRFYAETDFLPAIEKYTPDLLEEVRGIAEGSGRNFDEVLARQLSDEDPWFRQIVKFDRPVPGAVTGVTPPEHCTSLGTFETGHSLIAQNMDSPAYYDGFQMLLHVSEPESDTESYVFTVAGKLSLAGMNNHGVGICCNTVLQLNFNPRGLAEDFIVRKVLQQPTLEDALQFMRSIPHASGQNYILGGPESVVDLECSASKVVEFIPLPDRKRVYHTNHPLTNDDTQSWNELWARGESEDLQMIEQIKKRMTTFDRFATLKREVELDIPLDSRRAVEILSDHTAPVCLHHLQQGNYTLSCLIMELGAENPRLNIAGGPPCSTPFRTYTFD